MSDYSRDAIVLSRTGYRLLPGIPAADRNGRSRRLPGRRSMSGGFYVRSMRNPGVLHQKTRDWTRARRAKWHYKALSNKKMCDRAPGTDMATLEDSASWCWAPVPEPCLMLSCRLVAGSWVMAGRSPVSRT